MGTRSWTHLERTHLHCCVSADEWRWYGLVPWLKGTPMDELDSPNAPDRASRGFRGHWLLPAGAGVLLLVLLVLVAIGTQAHYSQQLIPPAAKAALQNPLTEAFGQLAVIGLMVAVGLIVVAILVMFPWSDITTLNRPAPPKAAIRRRDTLGMVGLAFTMLIALIVLIIFGLKRRRKPFSAGIVRSPSASHARSLGGTGSVPVGTDLLIALVIVLTVVIVAFLGHLSRRRNSHWKSAMEGVPPLTELPEELAAAMQVGLEELSVGGDPRSAVILAYLRMEQALGEHGLVRRQFETPGEYLRRATAGLSATSQALARLTDLYQRARYSDQPVGPRMRMDAESALSSLRDELLATS